MIGYVILFWLLGTIGWVLYHSELWLDETRLPTGHPTRKAAARRVLWAPLWPVAAASWLWINGDEFVRDLRGKP